MNYSHSADKNIFSNKKHPVLMWIMILSILLGAFIRFKGLGKWPLGTDEYFIARSVENILKHGLPEFDCGGYYPRGIIYQYLAAFLQLFPGNKEFFLRVIPAICSLLAIHPLYRLGKRFNSVTGYFVVILFCFSLWEIEFARFARMYAPFQVLSLYYFLFFVKAILDNNIQSRNYCLLLSGVAIFIYEGAVFLLLMNFIMLIQIGNQSRKRDIIIAIMVFIGGYLYLSTDFRHLGVVDHMPSDILDLLQQGDDEGPILLPIILLKYLSGNTSWIFAFLIPLTLSIVTVFYVLKNKLVDYKNKFFLVVLILFSILNLFGCIVFATTILLLMNWFRLKDLRLNIFKAAIVVAVCNLFFWILYGMTSEAWHVYWGSADTFNAAKKLLVTLFKYPDIFEQIVYPWLFTIPVTGLMIVVFVGGNFLFWLYKKGRQVDTFSLLTAMVLLICAFIGIIRTPYYITRYTFFLYPVMLLLVVASMINISSFVTKRLKYQNVVLGFFVIGFIVFSEDYQLNHMLKIDSKEINFRMNYTPPVADHYYYRKDVRSPSEFVNKNIKENEIVITTKRDVDFYVNRIDYYYEDFYSIELPGIIGCNGQKDIWNNANIVYHGTDLLDIVENHSGNVWMIINTDKYVWRKDIEKVISEKYKQYKQFTSLDGNLEVYKIPPKKTS